MQITPRLRQLLLLLSSDQPGEVGAAAAAIKRTLRNGGCDFHDLVAGLIASPSLAPTPRPTPTTATGARYATFA
jgi:hypothetical protein